MKNIFLTILLMVVAPLLAVGQQTTKVTRFEGKELRGLIVSGAFDVQLTQGKESSMSIEIRDDLKDKLNMDLTEEGFLRLSYGSDVGKFFSGKNRPIAKVVVTELNYLNLTGLASVIASGDVSASEDFRMTIGGSAFLDQLRITCVNASLEVGGTAKASLKVMCDDVKVETSGTGLLELGGTAKASQVVANNASTVNMLDMVSQEQRATATGMSKIKANVTGTADVVVGATSSFRYTGPGKVTGDGAKKL